MDYIVAPKRYIHLKPQNKDLFEKGVFEDVIKDL